VRLALRSRRARRLMADMLIAAQPYRGLGRRLWRDALRGVAE
jgi:hypothetical protein